MNSLITKRCSPIEEAIYQQGFQAGAASRDAEVAELKTVPMKYRRMAFNAQLQDEVAKLEKENDQLRAELVNALAACKIKDETLRELDQLIPVGATIAALAIQPDDSALEAIVKKAGEVMRERCASESCRSHEYDATKAIRTLPAVTLEDLK